MDLVAVGADLRNDPGHGDEDADVDLRGREDEAGPPLPSPGPRLAPAAPPALRHPVASPNKRQPRPGAFARGPEAALGCVCASKERARPPGAQSQRTARGGILGGGAHACSGPAAHRGEGAAVPEAHAPGSQLLPLADLGTGGGHSTADFPFCPMSPPCWGPVPTGVRAAGWGAGRSWQRPGRCESLL